MTHGKRDYSLTGRDGRLAVEKGLASAEWYHTDVPRKTMKELMQRRDGPAIRDTLIWIGSMVVLAAIAVWLWPNAGGAIPFFLAYGVLYGSATDSRWHECGHGTAFKTRWMNDAVYQIASFMIMRNPVTWRWSHTRHHTDTIIVGRDPEIVFMRPPDLLRILLNFFGIIDAFNAMKTMVMNAFGAMSAQEKTFVPESEQPKAIFVARIWFAIYAVVIALAVSLGSILPLMLVGLPRLYGAWHHVMTGLLQHGGLAENVIDHRLNSRTVYMNPGQPVRLLEYELPRGAPHVPDGAVSRAAETACADQGRPAGAEHVDPRRLSRDGARRAAPAEIRGLLPEAGTAADGQALQGRTARSRTVAPCGRISEQAGRNPS